jgi:hypothetical protein
MSTILVALQTAIYTTLDTGLTESVYVEGDVVDNASAIYVTIGNDTHIPWDTDGNTGWESTVTIHTWDTRNELRGFTSIKQLMGKVTGLLHRQKIPITGYQTVGMDEEFSETFIDSDGLTRHGVQRFRIISRTA